MTSPPLQPPVRVLMGPGPSDVHPRVLQAMANGTLGHLDPAFLEIMDSLQGMMRGLFRTTNPMTFAVSGTGSAGMEAAVLNLVEPGDRTVVCDHGYFGARLAEIAGRAGAELLHLEKPWGEVFTAEEIAEAVAKHRPKVVGIVLAETSTGIWQEVEEIAGVVRQAGALLVVDAVAALGGLPVEVDAWGLDVVYSGTQKCLSCPPGLAPITFGPRAMEAIGARKTKVRSWYFDVTLLGNYWGGERTYHHTAPINMCFGLYEALRLLEEEGLETCFARHRLNHRALKAGLEALGMRYTAPEGHQLPMLNAVAIPEGVNDQAVRRGLLRRFDIEIGGGLGAFAGKVWRIGLMGHSSRVGNVLRVLAALEQLLAEQGHGFEGGSGVAAANGVYREAATAAGEGAG